jgi:hypothetical protein
VAITRYRCTACGNLTRFDVVTTCTTRAFHHYTVGGELVVEEEEVRAESVDEVSCRWCGHGNAVEVLTGDVDLLQTAAPPGSAVSSVSEPDGAPGQPSPVR